MHKIFDETCKTWKCNKSLTINKYVCKLINVNFDMVRYKMNDIHRFHIILDILFEFEQN